MAVGVKESPLDHAAGHAIEGDTSGRVAATVECRTGRDESRGSSAATRPWQHHRWRSGITLEPHCAAGVTWAYELLRWRGDNPTRSSHWDRWYAKHQSVWVDIRILARTGEMVARDLLTSGVSVVGCQERTGQVRGPTRQVADMRKCIMGATGQVGCSVCGVVVRR